jgi:hypothetical protein
MREEDRQSMIPIFRCRVKLLAVVPGVVQLRAWSGWYPQVIHAQRHAAYLAHRQMEVNEEHPHDPTVGPGVVVHEAHVSATRNAADQTRGAIAELPLKDWPDAMLANVKAVVLSLARFSKPAAAAAACSDVLSVSRSYFVAQAPPNVGVAGEHFAAQWLRSSGLVVPASVKWLNQYADALLHHDIECEPLSPDCRRHVEGKTHWRGGRRVVSREQHARLHSQWNDYMLLIIEHFERLFQLPQSKPTV